jgi:uncharacterized membrane protein
MIEIIPNWHPLLVHFTVGLLSTSVLFYLASACLPEKKPWKQQWLNMANWSLWSGCLFAIGTAIAGWLAYNSVAHDSASHAAMTLHRNWALPTAATFLILGLSAIFNARKDCHPGFLFLTISIIAAGLLMVTGWLGSETVYRYGLGVKSLPKIEAAATDGHNHGSGSSHNESGMAEQEHSTVAIDPILKQQQYQQTTTEIVQPLKEDSHKYDHENKAIAPETEQAHGVSEHSHKTISENIPQTYIQPSDTESHFHDSNIEPKIIPLEQDSLSKEITLAPHELHSSEHTVKQVEEDHNHGR